MEEVVTILLFFILVNCLFKLSFWKWWQAAAFGLVCALFVVGSCRWAILQSKTQLADLLRNAGAMQDAAVWVTVESAVCFAFCFARLREVFGRPHRARLRVLHAYPGLLVFPALFYLQTQAVFHLPGTDFMVVSTLLAAFVFAAVPLSAALLRRMYPDEALRLEAHFLVSLFVCITGLIATVNGNVAYAAVEQSSDAGAMLLTLGLFALFFAAGVLIHKYKWRFGKSRNSGTFIHK
ncbi:MAG: hypothetical protein LBP64_08670 [Tannerella sp.]|jgi:hypothetical protein|nr:hypothetical protein [Tannerella sp.]